MKSFFSNALETAKVASGSALQAAQQAAVNAQGQAQHALTAALDAAREAQDEFERTFERMDCAVFDLNSRVGILEFPSEDKVERLAHLLNSSYGANILIVNMSEQQYDYSLFEGTVTEVQFLGLPAPPLELLAKLCLQCQEWLRKGPSHTIGVHCFTGFQRSIVFAACFLAWQGRYPHPVDALVDVCAAVGVDEQRILPSQKRYLTYFASSLLDPEPVTPLPHELLLTSCLLHGPPDIPDFRPYCEVWQDGQRVFSSEKEGQVLVYPDYTASFPLAIKVRGDVLLRVRWLEGGSRKTLFRIAFHTAFVPDGGMQFSKSDLDGHDGDKRWDSVDSCVNVIAEKGVALLTEEATKLEADFAACRSGRPSDDEQCEFLVEGEDAIAPCARGEDSNEQAKAAIQSSPPRGIDLPSPHDPSTSTDSDLVVVTSAPVVSSGATDSLDAFFDELDGIQGSADTTKSKISSRQDAAFFPDLPDFDEFENFTPASVPANKPGAGVDAFDSSEPIAVEPLKPTAAATAIDDLDEFFDEITKPKAR
jgi:hypothetical protein